MELILYVTKRPNMFKVNDNMFNLVGFVLSNDVIAMPDDGGLNVI